MSIRVIRHLFTAFWVAAVILLVASFYSYFRAPTAISRTFAPSCLNCTDIKEFDSNVKDLTLFRSLATTTACAALLSAIFGIALLEHKPKKKVAKRKSKKQFR